MTRRGHKPRGFYGIGIERGKTRENLGTLWRTAHLLGADFIFTVGGRYQRQVSDTTKAWRSVPLWNFNTLAELVSHAPMDAPLVGIELADDAADIRAFRHPERAIYLLGSEDHGLSKEAISRCHRLVKLPGDMSMNVATAGSLVMFDRWQKLPLVCAAEAAE